MSASLAWYDSYRTAELIVEVAHTNREAAKVRLNQNEAFVACSIVFRTGNPITGSTILLRPFYRNHPT